MRKHVRCCLRLFLGSSLLFTIGCGQAIGPVVTTTSLTLAAPAPASYTTSIAPAGGDDLAGPCSYDLQIFDKNQPLTGIWVLFQRLDILHPSNNDALWLSPDLRTFALHRKLGLIYAHQCNAASFNDLQSDGRRGPANALVRSVTQFAALSRHPEMALAPISLFGFSAAGVLSLTIAETMPTRIATVVAYAAGSAPLELRQLTPSDAQTRIPILILANADDNFAGNTMSLQYFRSGLAAGGPWGFAIQPGVDHCCNLSTLPVLLPWMDAVLTLRTPDSGTGLADIDRTRGWTGAYTCTPDAILDGLGYTDCRFTAAAIQQGVNLTAEGTAWLPGASFAEAWLAWVGKP